MEPLAYKKNEMALLIMLFGLQWCVRLRILKD